jgi:ABC-2 type transport system ATP-binding protein/ABC-2 type transport system permease protein
MNPRLTLATAARILRQIGHDPRTIALLLVVPSLLIGLMSWIFSNGVVFDTVGPALLGLFPFIVMFLVTSISTLRERRSGTLERLMTMPIGKLDFVAGYTIAFGVLAIAQALIAVGFAVGVCGLTVKGPLWLLLVVALADGLLGTSLGLLASAFAQTEFQVVQFMPALIFPQILLGGIFIARSAMPDVLRSISDWLPLTHAINALTSVSTETDATADVFGELWIVLAFAAGAVVLGAVSLRRTTA